MTTVLLEPTDVLFFRDAVPMSAGQGRGAGARLPFPSTVHEALRASLLLSRGVEGLPKTTTWTQRNGKGERFIATRDFQSLRTVGPFPWTETRRLLLPVPLDAVRADQGKAVACLELWRDPTPPPDATFRPCCLPVAVTPPDKLAQLSGWWEVAQYTAYLRGETLAEADAFEPIRTDTLWQEEARVGVALDPGTFAAESGKLFAGGFLRADEKTRFAAQFWLGEKSPGTEQRDLAGLDWLLLGGERRLARLHRASDDVFAALPPAPEFGGPGPCLLKWTLVTPAIFAHGALPGWCSHPLEKPDGLPQGRVRLGVARAQSRRRDRPESAPLPGRAQLIAWCLGRPLTVSGWDTAEHAPKPTQLAVPAGSAYYFLCEDAATANALAARLHWHPRSDRYGDKGCGYGLCSAVARMHPQSSADVPALAARLFSPNTPA